VSLEFLDEKKFYVEITSTDQIWVAKGDYNNIYFLDVLPQGVCLPVWSNQEKVFDYLKNARPIGPPYSPFSVSLDRFSETWMTNPAMSIKELAINPNGASTRMLIVSTEEFLAARNRNRKF